MSDAQTRIDQLVKSNEVVLFMKGNASFPQCGFSGRAIQILKACGVDTKGIQTVNVLEDDAVRQGIKEYSNWPTIPQLYVKGEFLGGSDIMIEMYEAGELQELVEQHGLAIEPTVVQRMQDLSATGEPLTVPLVGRLMKDLYRGLVNDQAHRYAELFEHLLQADAPVVFHCTAGKDRTGFAAALILLALDVPRDVVQ